MKLISLQTISHLLTPEEGLKELRRTNTRILSLRQSGYEIATPGEVADIKHFERLVQLTDAMDGESWDALITLLKLPDQAHRLYNLREALDLDD